MSAPGLPPFGGRFYDEMTGTPIVGERDRSVDDGVNDLCAERRDGYG